MKPKDFEQAVLDLAMTTRVPLTRANILFYTGAASRQADKWLDSMMADGLLDVDTDDEGTLIYTLRGGKRPEGGPQELARCGSCGRASVKGVRCSRCGGVADARLRELKSQVDRAGTALSLLQEGHGLLNRPPKEGDKSLVVAAALGLFTGPFGWLYAAPLREAVPAVLAFVILWKLIGFLMFALLPIMPASAIIGALYAWRYNRAGRRAGLLTEEDGRAG